MGKEEMETRLAALTQELAQVRERAVASLTAKDGAAASLMANLKSNLECAICTELVVGVKLILPIESLYKLLIVFKFDIPGYHAELHAHFLPSLHRSMAFGHE